MYWNINTHVYMHFRQAWVAAIWVLRTHDVIIICVGVDRPKIIWFREKTCIAAAGRHIDALLTRKSIWKPYFPTHMRFSLTLGSLVRGNTSNRSSITNSNDFGAIHANTYNDDVMGPKHPNCLAKHPNCGDSGLGQCRFDRPTSRESENFSYRWILG